MYTLIETIFNKLLTMSITASYVILFVLFIRFVLRKAPKIHSYFLWSVVLFRLTIPFSIASVFSLLQPFNAFKNKFEQLPLTTEPAEHALEMVMNAEVVMATTQEVPINDISTPLVQQLNQSSNAIFSMIWILGVVAMVGYSLYTYIQFKRKIATAIKVEAGIYESDQISTAFVLGIIKPKIYLPMRLSVSERLYIIKHEQVHIKRRDYLIKPLALITLFVHWFNPLVWISFILMNRDMEMSCDENVVEALGVGIKKEYSQSLLTLNASRTNAKRLFVLGGPLAFGESNAKRRIKNLLSYKKPALWITMLTMILVVLVGCALGTNPEEPVITDAPDTQEVEKVDIEKIALTLDALKVLSQKGDALTWSDFDAYAYMETGSGLYIRVYAIEPEYEVWIGGSIHLEEKPMYITLKNTATNAKADVRTEDVAQFLADEIQIEDLTETKLITADALRETQYPLIAELPEDDLYLYGQPKGAVLKHGDEITVFDWIYMTPRFILPTMAKYDVNDDGADEIICVLNTGSGTGISIEELHVLKMIDGKYYDHVFDDYKEKLSSLIKYEYDKDLHQVKFITETSTYIHTIEPENQAFTFEGINMTNIVGFDISDGLKIKLAVAIIFEEQATPMFIDTIELVGEIEYMNGYFEIRKLEVVEVIE